MNRNKQNIASLQRGGYFLGENTGKVLHNVGLQRYAAGGEILSGIADVLKEGANYLESKNRLEENKNVIVADSILKNYREALASSKSMEEFDEIAQNMGDGVKNYFSGNESGKNFFEKHGEQILSLNNADVEKLRKIKEYDFGKNDLDVMLAGNQYLLQDAKGDKGSILLKNGYDEINNTVFLSDEEKKEYRQKFLKNGIYNLALSDGNKAKEEALKYKDFVNENMIEKIDEIEKIKLKDQENLEIANQKKEYMNKLGEAINLWQMKERGEIQNAEYNVLAMEHNDFLWGENNIDDSDNDKSLSLAYQLVRKLNEGGDYEPKEISDVSNYLMRAYKNNKIGFEEVANLQNQLLALDTDKKTKERLFDNEIDVFLDRVIGNDVGMNSNGANIAMDEKAKMAFKLYDTYLGKKIALLQGFSEKGGTITPKVERVLKKQAMNEIKNEFGYKENIDGEFSFGELKKVFKQYYNGSEENEVWKKFYEKAPFAEDKKELLKNIAKQQMSKEIFYPSFDNWAEVLDADLDEGDKFYFRGRLAVKA